MSGSAPSSVRKQVFPASFRRPKVLPKPGPITAACESDSAMEKHETSDGPMEAVLVHLASASKRHLAIASNSNAMVKARYNDRCQV